MLKHAHFILFSYRGRISRSQFWLGLAISVVLLVACGGIAAQIDRKLSMPQLWPGSPVGDVGPIEGILLFALGAALLAVPAKRLHDRGRSAAELAAFVLPVLNILKFVELGFFRGIDGANEWGPDPVNSRGWRETTREPNQQPAPREDIVARLRAIKQLLDEGALTDDEFEQLKAGLLATGIGARGTTDPSQGHQGIPLEAFAVQPAETTANLHNEADFVPRR